MILAITDNFVYYNILNCISKNMDEGIDNIINFLNSGADF